MTLASFQDRLARLQPQPAAAAPAFSAPPTPARTGGPGFFATVLIGMLVWPIGFALSFVTGVFLDPAMTSAAVNYHSALYLLGGGHLALLAGGIAVIAARFRQGMLNRVMLMALVGYGMGSAALTLVTP